MKWMPSGLPWRGLASCPVEWPRATASRATTNPTLSVAFLRFECMTCPREQFVGCPPLPGEHRLGAHQVGDLGHSLGHEQDVGQLDFQALTRHLDDQVARAEAQYPVAEQVRPALLDLDLGRVVHVALVADLPVQ